MPHNLTEADSYDANVAVPDDGDAAVASSVATPFQAVANRTKKLKADYDSISAARGLLTLGASLLSSAADALLARVTAATAANATLPYTRLGSFGGVNVYIGASDGTPSLVFAVNAAFGTGSTWTKITTGQLAFLVRIARDRLQVGQMPAAQDTAWTNAFVVGDGTTSGWGRLADMAVDGTADTASLADLTRLFFTFSGQQRTLLVELKGVFGAGNVRVYYVRSGDASINDAIQITYNAKWANTAANWTLDVTGISSTLILGPKNAIARWHVSATAGTTFDDTLGAGSWSLTPFLLTWPTAASGAGDESLFDFGNGRFRWLNTQTAQAGDANPPSSAAIGGNELCAKTVCKSWGKIAVAPGGVSVSEGYNIASVTRDIGANTITVNFTVSMQSANYAVLITTLGSTADQGRATAQATGSFTASFHNLSTTPSISVVDVDADTFDFFFAVFARQDT